MSSGLPWKRKLSLKLGHAPNYRIGERPSEKNGALWIMEVWNRKHRIGTGKGFTKEDAEQHAAFEALDYLYGSSRRVRTLITELGEERGKYSEDRVACVFQDADHRPSWFQSIEKAPFELDQQGIDFIVETNDLGKLWLQVKSSTRGASDFLEVHRGQPIAVVVVRINMTDALLRTSIVTSLVILRESILRRRAAS